MKLTVLVPLFNEEGSCRELTERIHSACSSLTPFEILVVDDGSTDESFSRLSLLNYESLNSSQMLGNQLRFMLGFNMRRVM